MLEIFSLKKNIDTPSGWWWGRESGKKEREVNGCHWLLGGGMEGGSRGEIERERWWEEMLIEGEGGSGEGREGGYRMSPAPKPTFLARLKEAFVSKMVQKSLVFGVVVVVLVALKLPAVLILPLLVPLFLFVLLLEWLAPSLVWLLDWMMSDPWSFFGWLVVVVVVVVGGGVWLYKKAVDCISQFFASSLLSFVLLLSLLLVLSSFGLSSFPSSPSDLSHSDLSLLSPLFFYILLPFLLLISIFRLSAPPPPLFFPSSLHSSLLETLQNKLITGNFKEKYICFFFYSSSSRLGRSFAKELCDFYEGERRGKEGGVEFVSLSDDLEGGERVC